jgi:hypothetical protein
MKFLLGILFLYLSIPLSAQEYPFAKDFVNGTITLKDSTQKNGQLKWFPQQNEKLKFRENEKSDTKKYAPEDLLGFNTDSLKFVSLSNLEVYAEEYPLIGKMTKVKHTFGQLIDSGTFNIYFLVISGYNAMSGAIQTYANFLFEKKTDSGYQYAAYPFRIRMKDRKYENAKDDLYVFFKNYPDLVEKIRVYKQQDDFFAIIDAMKAVN